MKFVISMARYISTLFAISFLTDGTQNLKECGIIVREIYSLIGNVAILMAIELWIDHAKNGNK